MTGRLGAVTKFIFRDFIGSVFWFPVWWYTSGLARVVSGSLRAIAARSKEYGLQIWLRNFFVPMYGEYDITGRLVSVFMRFAVLIGRLVAIAVETVLYALGILAWGAAPIVFLALALSSAGAFLI